MSDGQGFAWLGWTCVGALVSLNVIRFAAEIPDGSQAGEVLWFGHALIMLVLGYAIGRRVGLLGWLGE